MDEKPESAEKADRMSRKRSFSDSDGSMERRIPSKVQRVWDPYCWLCHKRDTNQRCSTCNLSYHRHCIGVNGPKIKHYKCELCNRMREAEEDYTKRQVDMNEFHRILANVVKRMFDDKSFQRLKSFDDRTPLNGGPSLINPYNLDIVSEKVDDKQYKSTVEFLKDIRQIRHNAEVVSTDGMKRLAIARSLEAWCTKVVYDIEICGQCYVRSIDSDDWFTEVCDPPHMLVWAKVSGYPHWPAKVIGIMTTANRLDVRFFGDHDMSNVSAQDCFLFPSKNPTRHLAPDVVEKIKASIKEAKKYIHNIETKYKCDVPLFEKRITLEVRRVGEALTKMIPGLVLPPNYKLKRKPNFLQKTQCHRARSSISPQTQPQQTQPQSSPLSLTPPPSSPSPSPSPTPLPSTPLLSDDGKPIKHSLSRDELHKMNQLTLKIHQCDVMPEFIAASKKMKSSSAPSDQPDQFQPDAEYVDEYEDSTVVDLITDNVQTDVEFVEVDVIMDGDLNGDVIMDGDLNEDESFTSLHYSASESTLSKNPSQNFDVDQLNDENDAIPNDENNVEFHAIEQPADITDEIEMPSPPIEPNESPIADQPLLTHHEQLILDYRTQLEMLKQQLNTEFKPEIQRLNKIINENRSTMKSHFDDMIKIKIENKALQEDKMKMQTENEQLKIRLTAKDAAYGDMQRQHGIEMQRAIEDTKSKRWCVNCKKEARITQYKVPLCTTNCLLVYFEESKKRAERSALSHLGN